MYCLCYWMDVRTYGCTYRVYVCIPACHLKYVHVLVVCLDAYMRVVHLFTFLSLMMCASVCTYVYYTRMLCSHTVYNPTDRRLAHCHRCIRTSIKALCCVRTYACMHVLYVGPSE